MPPRIIVEYSTSHGYRHYLQQGNTDLQDKEHEVCTTVPDVCPQESIAEG